MWEFQHMNMEKLPKHLQRDLRRLIRYVYRAHRETPPPGTTISIGYTDSRPECSWANIIELHPDWTLVSAYLAQGEAWHKALFSKHDPISPLTHRLHL